VTTVVLGNCGVGFAPCRAADHERLVKVMEGVEDIPGVVMSEGLPWTWETFPEYLDALEARQRDIDVAAFLPHSPLRIYVMGERGAAGEPATEDDMAQMRALTREAIEAGALGAASSRQFAHRTKAGALIPSYAAAAAELKAIACGMTDAGRGVMQVVPDVPHMPWEGEIERLIEVATASGRPLTFSMGTPNAGDPIWLGALEQVEAANAAGAKLIPQILPRPVGMLASHELSVNPFCLCPSYAALAGLPIEAKIAELRRPEMRARLLAETPAEGHPLSVLGRMWDWMFPFSDPPNYAPPLETSIAAQARARGVPPQELAYDMLLEHDGKAMFYITMGNYYEGKLDALGELLRRPGIVMGLGDGGAHYGAICDASYPTFFLTYWARDRPSDRLTIGETVRALARKPAEAVGLLDRGLLRPGYKADINVIDFGRLVLHAPIVRHDLPAGGLRLDQAATGYEATIVSGRIIRRNDEPTDELPGRVIRGQQPAPTMRTA
jgi:N-acyl-D-aspartate/D-glutamate deacylase